jgi:hypothetical protein
MKTLVTLQVALTEADISQNLTISIFLGTVETNFKKMVRSRPRFEFCSDIHIRIHRNMPCF